MASRLSVVFVVDAFLLRAGLEQLINEIPGLSLTEVFEGSEKSIASKITNLNPDVVIINPASLKVDFLNFISELNEKSDCLSIGLFDQSTPENIKSHFKACLDKNQDKFELVEKFRSILKINKLESYQKEEENAVLSEREKTIVKQVVNGLTNQEIANKLFLSIHTVTTHRKNISNKLGIKTVSGLTVYALMNKIVELNEIDHR